MSSILGLIQNDVLQDNHIGDGSLFALKGDGLRDDEICFYKVKRLTFDEDYPHREAFENVLQTQDNEAFNFVYILDGDVRDNIYRVYDELSRYAQRSIFMSTVESSCRSS